MTGLQTKKVLDFNRLRKSSDFIFMAISDNPLNQNLFMKPLIQKIVASILFTLFSISTVYAQAPTQEQIDRFKRLPPAQQQALARSFGVDFSDLDGLLEENGGDETEAEPISGNRRDLTKSGRNSNRNLQGGQIPLNGFDLDNIDPNDLEGLSGVNDLLDGFESNEEEDELKLFGHNIFNYGAETFAPAEDIPIPVNYLLGPGDTIVIQLYGKENATHTLKLNREGQIQFPDIGPISLAGLPFEAMQEKLTNVVNEQMIGVKSSITMGPLRTVRVFVLGEAEIPGSYVVSSLSTMTNAIFASGGITEIGSLRNIQLKRAGKVVARLDLYDLLLRGDTSDDSRLLPGDVIFIPPVGKTTGISGAVKRPAIYELKNERTVADVIQLAGGLLANAYAPASRIERISRSGEKTLVNIDISSPSGRSFKVNDADIIQIQPTLETVNDTITLEGHVKREGDFAWRKFMRFTDIVPNADELLPNPDIVIGLIQREEKITRRTQVHLFSPQQAFASPQGPEDPLLQPRDVITLFEYDTNRVEILKELVDRLKVQSNFSQRQQTIRIYGSVRFPGEYPLATGNMSARELISLAGGLTESAQGSGAEITRYDLNENRERVDLRKDFDLTMENPQLKAGDTLRIKQIPLWQKRESVELTGEVIYPGVYDLLPGETLLSVIERAGGLTPYAYPEGAIFSRKELRLLEEERLENLKVKIASDLATANLEKSAAKKEIDKAEADQILNSIESTKALGRMVIDLPTILDRPKKFDFELADGDKLEIPRFKPSVTVVGEIQHSTSHFYDARLDIKDYIDMSGGTKQNADKKRIYVVKANGRVYAPASSAWFKSNSKALQPGDTIVVPINTTKVDSLTLWSSVAQIVSSAALGIAALGNL